MKIDVAVADSGPLHYLALINHASVLEHLFGRVLTPEAVRAELLHPNAPPAVKSFMNSPPVWLQFTPVRDVSKLSPLVHRGEAETIQVAIESHAQTVLIDDSQGRKLAYDLGLTVLGTVGILEIAASRDLVDFPTALGALRRTNIFIAETILTAALERDKSRKSKTQNR
jgi:predicted nucleic acid-binding protein